jgi:predicted nucleotidyltransferase
MEELLRKIAKALDESNIPYMIIGGQAVLLYRSPRFTNDIDITLDINVENLDRLIQVINTLNFKIMIDNPDEFVNQTMVLPVINETGIRIDFIFSNTLYESEAISRARKIDMNGIQVNFASPEDLIIHKIFSGREIDFEDVKMILVMNKNLNTDLILTALKQLGEAVNIDFVGQFNRIRQGL